MPGLPHQNDPAGLPLRLPLWPPGRRPGAGRSTRTMGRGVGAGGLKAGPISRNPAGMTSGPDRPAAPRLRIRIVFGEAEMMGPGKAELLERIARTGSIAAAGREMKMSYKRAWTLIETLNAMFREPVVESARGGPGVGGATLTATGRKVLAAYRAVEAEAARAGAAPVARLQGLMRDMSEER